MTCEQKGITLLELMTVIACMAILAAIAIPNWLTTSRPLYQLKNAARQIVSDMRYAQSRSVAANRQYRITFDPVTDSYILEKWDLSSNSSSWEQERKTALGTEEGEPSAVDLVGGTQKTEVSFRPTGEMDAATITLRNLRGSTIQIICSRAGRIRMVRDA